MAWDIEGTDEFTVWYHALDDDFEVEAINEAVRRLASEGPGLGRPLVDRVHQSKYQNMKDLRPLARTLRILFIFDPRRTAILLLGGDKEGEWNAWYDRNVPRAEMIYETYQRELQEEGLLP